MTSWEYDYLCLHGHRDRNANYCSTAGVEYASLRHRRVLRSELFKYTPFCSVLTNFTFFPHIEGDGRTHEKHASPQRTWKPEGKVWEQSCILPFCAVYMSLSGRSYVLFFIQAECTIYIYASFSYVSCDKADCVLLTWKLRRQTVMWKKAFLYFFDGSEIKLKTMIFRSWQFHAWFLGSTRILPLAEL